MCELFFQQVHCTGVSSSRDRRWTILNLEQSCANSDEMNCSWLFETKKYGLFADVAMRRKAFLFVPKSVRWSSLMAQLHLFFYGDLITSLLSSESTCNTREFVNSLAAQTKVNLRISGCWNSKRKKQTSSRLPI